MSSSKTKYRCQYCGTDDICDTLSPWALQDKRCKVCNHSKFDEKTVAERDVNYYDEETED